MNNDELRFLQTQGWLNSEADGDNGGGCWTARRIDSLIILVVDALRFDFAKDHLPLSVGRRLFPESSLEVESGRGFSRLYQFVADPPTVTMQRLKALTTGGLPTFADITGSFGGASVEEDTWVEQLIATRNHRVVHHNNSTYVSEIAFVGDDTWVDLFPTHFDDAHPYPSFNTRDLDTVDNGCMVHLPRLLDGLIGLNKNETQTHNTSHFELIVSHFLGVDHVGHTYGPHDKHMEKKLHQMDLILSHSLDLIDASPQTSCVAAFVFGDHGMTEDGNHGGGSSEEMNAGLFAHYSPGCQMEHDKKLDGEEIGIDSIHAFDSINQIDLVPTISILLGLPIPYANIGGVVPELLPAPRRKKEYASESSFTPHATLALALNAAQVWTYFDDYSKTSRDLPIIKLRQLKELLNSATLVYKQALSESKKHSTEENSLNDSSSFRKACSLYKLFLSESTELGKRVWTQFNESGMMLGIGIMVLAWLAAFPLWRTSVRAEMCHLFCYGYHVLNGHARKGHEKTHANHNAVLTSSHYFRLGEVAVSFIFMIFLCGVLTFSNSYIVSEREVVTMCLSVLCLLVFRRWFFAAPSRDRSIFHPLVVALCTRLNDVFVSGHGLDPSIRLHAAHHPLMFLSSLVVLGIIRLRWLGDIQSKSSLKIATLIDVIVIICLAFSWLDKRSTDHSRNGLYTARVAIAFTLVGMLSSAKRLLQEKKSSTKGRLMQTQLALYRVMVFIIIVTGPSAASTGVLILIQTASLGQMNESLKSKELDAPVMAAIWRLTIRHAFFATNHHCSFNRLQFSAAFVATNTFIFHIAGTSLFLNTYGWEIIGSILVLVISRCSDTKHSEVLSRKHVWYWFIFYQWTEILTSCISVTLMKRHLMVWAIFAPRFMFAAVFTVLNLILCFLDIGI